MFKRIDLFLFKQNDFEEDEMDDENLENDSNQTNMYNLDDCADVNSPSITDYNNSIESNNSHKPEICFCHTSDVSSVHNQAYPIHSYATNVSWSTLNEKQLEHKLFNKPKIIKHLVNDNNLNGVGNFQSTQTYQSTPIQNQDYNQFIYSSYWNKPTKLFYNIDFLSTNHEIYLPNAHSSPKSGLLDYFQTSNPYQSSFDSSIDPTIQDSGIQLNNDYKYESINFKLNQSFDKHSNACVNHSDN